MLSNPGVICFDSGEHFVMLFLCILGILCYPMTIISWATYTTCSYPSRITSGRQHVLDVHPGNQEVIELQIPMIPILLYLLLFNTRVNAYFEQRIAIGSQFGDDVWGSYTIVCTEMDLRSSPLHPLPKADQNATKCYLK